MIWVWAPVVLAVVLAVGAVVWLVVLSAQNRWGWRRADSAARRAERELAEWRPETCLPG